MVTTATHLQKFLLDKFVQKIAITSGIMNVAYMQKVKVGHRAKFRDKNKCFLEVLFPVGAILGGISTSGVVRARLLRDIFIHSADAYTLVMAWVGYARARG